MRSPQIPRNCSREEYSSLELETRGGYRNRSRAVTPGMDFRKGIELNPLADRKLRNNTLIPKGSPWYLQQAESINEDGQIVGYGTIGGNIHAFLATPCDEDPD